MSLEGRKSTLGGYGWISLPERRETARSGNRPRPMDGQINHRMQSFAVGLSVAGRNVRCGSHGPSVPADLLLNIQFGNSVAILINVSQELAPINALGHRRAQPGTNGVTVLGSACITARIGRHVLG